MKYLAHPRTRTRTHPPTHIHNREIEPQTTFESLPHTAANAPVYDYDFVRDFDEREESRLQATGGCRETRGGDDGGHTRHQVSTVVPRLSHLALVPAFVVIMMASRGDGAIGAQVCVVCGAYRAQTGAGHRR